MPNLKSIVLGCMAMLILAVAACQSQQKTRKATFEGPESKTEIEVKTTDKD